jgi:4-amino-4-deoxy-L-arabinose transferase-like glycosyltransferase
VRAAEALGMAEARQRIWVYRLPSLAGAIGAVLLTYWTALAFVSRRGAVLAGLMLAGSILLAVEARLAKTDAMLLLAITAAMGAMARAYLAPAAPGGPHSPGRGVAVVFWTALAAGVLLKGPVILMVVGLAALALALRDRTLDWVWGLRPVGGAVWFLALVLPWFIAITLRGGSSFFVDSVGSDMLSKVASGQESHGAPPGYYALLFWLTFWPAATLAGLAAPAVWRARSEPGMRYLLAWVVPAWIVFELVVTKLPHYVLPLYPAIAILLAAALERHALVRRPLLELGLSWWFLVPLLLGGAALAGAVLLGDTLGLLAWPVAAAAVASGAWAWRFYARGGAEGALLRALMASVLTGMAVFGVVLPAMSRVFPAVSIAQVLHQAGCRQPLAAAAGYHEPSLVFLAGTATLLTDGAGAAEFLQAGGCRFAFVEARQEPAFLDRAAALRLSYSAGPRIAGVNYNGGRAITIAVYRAGTRP